MLPTTASQEETLTLLFEGIDPETVDFKFVFKFAAELFTHLGIACTCYYRHPTVGEMPDNGSCASSKSRRAEIGSWDALFGYRIHIEKYRRAAQGGHEGWVWETQARGS